MACEGHTFCPENLTKWQHWAKQMKRTHRVVQCPDCKLYKVWVMKR